MISAVSEFEIWLRVWSEHLRNLRAVHPVSSAKRWHCQFWQQIAVAHLPNLAAETTRCVPCVHGKMGWKYVTTTTLGQNTRHPSIIPSSILYLYYIDLYWSIWTSWNINPTGSNWIQLDPTGLFDVWFWSRERLGVTLQMACEACHHPSTLSMSWYFRHGRVANNRTRHLLSKGAASMERAKQGKPPISNTSGNELLSTMLATCQISSSSYCLTILTSVQKSKDNCRDNKDITTQVPRWKMDPLPLWILMAPDLSICRSVVDLLTGPAAGWPGCKDRRRPRES